ncbi:MAG: FadR family transcriptional regulator [Planctomycetes bacterium]|nr:FadR family transcriptional regulator [Planctomycetota bacterium]
MFKPIEVRRVSDEVAHQLRSLIFTHEFAPGQQLPPERHLADRLACHRSSVREALKRLESEGLVDIRRGDGIYVRDFMKEANLAALEAFLFTPQNDLLPAVQEFRILIQKEMARLAALRRTTTDLAELDSALATGLAADDPHAFRAIDWRFHQTLARATQNVLFTLCMNSVRELHERWGAAYFAVAGTISTTRRFHRLLARAVRRRDEHRAAALMGKLLDVSNPILIESLQREVP